MQECPLALQVQHKDQTIIGRPQGSDYVIVQRRSLAFLIPCRYFPFLDF